MSKKRFALLISLAFAFLLILGMPVFAGDANGVEVNAVVFKTPGNTNTLSITVTDDDGVYAESFTINNNAKGSYDVGRYVVYVSTFGNTKVEECYIKGVVASDLSTFDMSQPYEEVYEYINENGELTTLELEFRPAPQPRDTFYWASTGTWTIKRNNIVIGMGYKFDVGRSGSQWTVSNPRELTNHAYLATITSASVVVNRATSTSQYRAEVYGSMQTKTGIYTSTAWLLTTISSQGEMLVSWRL